MMNVILNREEYDSRISRILKECLPQEVLNDLREKLAIMSTCYCDGFRVARRICSEKEIIILSERIFPKRGAKWDSCEMRYFTFAILHEIAHVYKNHRSPKLDKLTEKEVEDDEEEANQIAFSWYNAYVKRKDNPYLKPLTIDEVIMMKEKNKKLMIKFKKEGVYSLLNCNSSNCNSSDQI